MIFSSNIFIYTFLPLCILFYFTSRRLFKSCMVANVVLLMFSCLFYVFSSGKMFAILILSALISYLAGICINRSRDHSRIICYVAVMAEAIILVYFKYFNFILDNISKMSQLVLKRELNVSCDIILPIGISFFIFQSIAYIFDVYRENVEAQPNFIKFFLYISFFPQLIAGPIVRYDEIYNDIDSRRESWDDVYEGLCRFVIGLSKKVLIADILGASVDKIYSSDISELTMALSWSAAFFYMLEIYFDFSGYSDMAIGMARIFGFHFNENFDRPYKSKSITEFWRKWHISLSSWLRDYIYIPLGGNRKGEARTYINQLIVFFICGLWHGAAWNFVIWGMYNGILLLIEKVIKKRYKYELHSWYGNFFTGILVLLGWVLFRGDNLGQSLDFYKSMFGILKPTSYIYYKYGYYVDMQVIAVAIIGAIIAFAPMDRIESFIKENVILKNFCIIALLVISMIYMSDSSFNAFIYFRF